MASLMGESTPDRARRLPETWHSEARKPGDQAARSIIQIMGEKAV
jgi:hypothetical protein